jgi:acetamidase/formamidase
MHKLLFVALLTICASPALAQYDDFEAQRLRSDMENQRTQYGKAATSDGREWPVAETDSHWITLGLDKDLNVAMTLAARNAIKFLAAQAKISELDAYALCSIAVSFRVTQVVDIVRGVHAMIPKAIFAQTCGVR